MLLKLRKDAQAHQGAGFDLHRFHDDFLGMGLLPFSVLRQQMLGDANDGVVLA